jgi:hypothetical protein
VLASREHREQLWPLTVVVQHKAPHGRFDPAAT